MKTDLRHLLKNPQRHFGKGPWTVASAPGRADFLNTHQDYKGLPVVPVGIDLRTFIFAKVLNGGIFRVRSLNLEEELGEPYVDIFRAGKNDMLGKGWFGNYFHGIINVLVERGYIRWCAEVGVPAERLQDKGARAARAQGRFWPLLEWIAEKPKLREKLVKTGWKSWRQKWRKKVFTTGESKI